MSTEAAATLLALAYLAGAVLLIAWVILPFLLMGLKPLLRDILAEQRRTNALLEQRTPKT